MIAVRALSVTLVKGTRLRSVQAISLGAGGADGNRRFYVIDERGRMVNGKTLGPLTAVEAALEHGRLTLALPDGRTISASPSGGELIQTRFFSRSRPARLLDGPFSRALSELCGQPVRLVEAVGGGAVDRGARGAVTLISRASLNRLAAEAGADRVDARRFRMLIEVDGVEEHAEDAWVGRRARVGEALVAWRGHVGRCLVTGRDPDTGAIDLPTLEVLRAYRGGLAATEPLPFGIYGEVIEPGAVRVGDALIPM